MIFWKTPSGHFNNCLCTTFTCHEQWLPCELWQDQADRCRLQRWPQLMTLQGSGELVANVCNQNCCSCHLNFIKSLKIYCQLIQAHTISYLNIYITKTLTHFLIVCYVIIVSNNYFYMFYAWWFLQSYKIIYFRVMLKFQLSYKLGQTSCRKNKV